MGEVTYSGRGFTGAYDAQWKHARAVYGKDDLASLIKPAEVTPSASPGFALEVARFWLGVAPACVERAIEAADTGPWSSGSATQAATGTTWIHKALADQVLERLRDGKLVAEEDIAVVGARSPLAAGILRTLTNMFVAIKAGALNLLPTMTESGIPLLNPNGCRLFWDSAHSCASGCSGSLASVTTAEKWSAFKDGAREGARDAAHAAGEAAGFVAATAGQAIGSGVSGFFGELGVVNVALIGLGGYIAVRIL